MNRAITLILISMISLAASGCGPGQVFGPTLTPTPTVTPTSTATPIPTQTRTPTAIPTSIAVAYNPVPRWMILAQPGYSIEILGEKWNYTGDSWGETYACIDYTREKEPSVSFEQCFGMIKAGPTFESELESFMQKDFETLIPKNTFNEVGQIALLAKRLDESGKKNIKFFEMVGTEQYLLLVEMDLFSKEDTPLQTIYEAQAAAIIDYVLQNSLEKSRILPRPTATPLSLTQESFYTSLAENLITESEASGLYGSTWESLGDNVSGESRKVCRYFEDRTNADVRWISFKNCVYLVDKDHTMKSFADFYEQRGYVVLQSHYNYSDQFALYAMQDGHTYFDAFLLNGDYIYLVGLESRTMAGEKPEDVFSEDVDDFLHGVLMTNVEK